MTYGSRRLTGLMTAAAAAFALAACEPRDEVGTTDTVGALGADTMAAGGELDRDMSEAGIFGLLAAANGAEIEAANIALQKAVNPSVRDFAQQMKTDHTAMMQQGEQLAQSLNVAPAVPRDRDLVEDHKDHTDDLAETGKDFDEEYLEGQITDHENALEMIDEALRTTQNAELRAHLEQARPKIESHLEMARQLKDQID